MQKTLLRDNKVDLNECEKHVPENLDQYKDVNYFLINLQILCNYKKFLVEFYVLNSIRNCENQGFPEKPN